RAEVPAGDTAWQLPPARRRQPPRRRLQPRRQGHRDGPRPRRDRRHRIQPGRGQRRAGRPVRQAPRRPGGGATPARGTAAVRDDGPAGGAGRREPAGQPLLSPHPSHRGGGPRRGGGHVSFDLDPVWPWARLYDMLTQVPPSVRAIALFAALTAAAVPIAAFARVRWLAWTLVAAGAVSVVFVARYLWAPAM